MDLVRQKQAEVEARTSGGEIGFFQFKEGDGVYCLRILPPFGDSRQFWVEYQKSFSVGPNKKIVVPLAQFGLDCPLQKRIDALTKQTDEVSKKEAQKLRPKSRVAMIVIDRKNEAAGPQVWETNLDVFRDILTIMADPDFGDITNPTNGTDLNVSYKKEGRTGFSEWTPMGKRQSSPLSANPAQLTEWTSKNWFEIGRVGQASEFGFIEACLAGTEAAYIESRKQQRQEGGSQQQQSAPPTNNTVASPPPPGAPVSPPAPVVHVEPVVTHRFVAGTQLWQSTAAGVTQTSVEDVCKRLKTEKPEAVQLMALDQNGGWMSAAAMGFQVTVPAPAAPAAPPPPSSPPAAPPPMPMAPPPPGGADIPFDRKGTPQSEEDALKQQLAGFQPMSQVAKDIAAALGR